MVTAERNNNQAMNAERPISRFHSGRSTAATRLSSTLFELKYSFAFPHPCSKGRYDHSNASRVCVALFIGSLW
ncbi:hypothetical protein Pla52o_50070 [Novipirellula galeiformis]|uniref:Uncharacterized protein n=1 Tax=Novipirellula galeiformis TaxID=2528004 RepID=A0A5C6C0Z6_9BACT|nr:hypothetical protein Pla52o_50070 [Novipirellula galeiformis]